MTKPKDGEPIRLVETGQGVRFRVVLDVAPPGGKRRQVTRTFDSIKSARDFVTTTRSGISSGTFTAPSSETVEALCTRWLASRVDVRPVTREGYRNVLSPALRRIGEVKVQALTVADLEALFGWLRDQGGRRGQALGPRSVRACKVALGQALDLAIRDKAIGQNPARLAKLPHVNAAEADDAAGHLVHWEPAELRRFMEHADTDALAGAWRLTLCGLRRSEVLGLRWSDVDLEAGEVRVRRGRVALDHGDHVNGPKSVRSRRTLPVEALRAGTVAALRALSARQAADKLRAGSAYVDSGMVVVDALGQPVRPEWYSDRFRALSKAAGVPSITLHSVRHSLGHEMDQKRIPPADAAALLGHSVEVFMSTYIPDPGRAGIDRAVERLARAVAAE